MGNRLSTAPTPLFASGDAPTGTRACGLAQHPATASAPPDASSGKQPAPAFRGNAMAEPAGAVAHPVAAGSVAMMMGPLLLGRDYNARVQPVAGTDCLFVHQRAQATAEAPCGAGALPVAGPGVRAGEDSRQVGTLKVDCEAAAAGSSCSNIEQAVVVTWDMDVAQVFCAADTSRSPCGANTRLASPSFSLAALPTAATPTTPGFDKGVRFAPGGASSPSPFHPQLHATPPSSGRAVGGLAHTPRVDLAPASAPGGGAPDSAWHLEFALFDHSDQHVSLYVCRTAAEGEGGDCAPCLSWHVEVLALDHAGGARFSKQASVPPHEYHCLEGHGQGQALSCWGLQGLLGLDELDMLTSAHQLRVVVTLRHHPAAADAAAAPAAPIVQRALLPEGGGALPPPGQHEPPPEFRVLLASLSPRIMVVDGFLDEQTCRDLIALAEPRLIRSRVSTGTETPSRTSQGTFFTGQSAQDPLILRVEERITQLVNHPAVIGGKRRLINTEALQVVRYTKGAFYTDHYDNRAGGQITRHATILVYLQNCPKGGTTFFPRATAPPTDLDVPPHATLDDVAHLSQHLHGDDSTPRPGLRIAPATGRALLFWSALPDGTEDLASLHAAETVEAGEKWITTRWFKEA